MSTEKAVARNTAVMMLSQVITWGATFALIVQMPRQLGAASYGRLNFASAVLGMLGLLVDFGTNTLVTREIARDRGRASAYVTNIVLLKVGTALVAYLALIASIGWLGRSPEVGHLMLILGVGMVISSASRLLDSVLQGFEKVNLLAWADVMDKVLSTGIVLALLAGGRGIVAIAWSIILVSGIHLLRSAYWALRLARPRLRLLSFRFVGEAVRGSLPFFLFAVFARVYDKVDVTMLGMMTSDTVVGYYGAAYRLFTSLFFLPYIFHTVTFPVLSRLWAANPEGYRQAVHRGFALLATAAVGVCVCTFLLAGPVVDLLYTQAKFPGTAPALRILALALLAQYLNTIVVIVLQTTDRQALWTRAGALAAVVNPAVNYALIPLYGHLGAAATTVVTEAMLLTLALRACPKGILDRGDLRVFGRAMAAGGVLAGGLLLGLRWGLLPAVALGLPVYLLAAVRFGVLSRDDLLMVAEPLLVRFSGK